MALNDTKVPSAASDVVAVLDSNFNQVFENARPIKALINENSRPMEHPLETGVIITDHRIILPVEIELSMILKSEDYRSTYEQIKLLYINAPFLTVQTRTSTYKNMIISSIPHQEDTELFDTITMALRMKEAQIVAPQSGTLPAASVKNPTDQSTIDRGNQQIGTNYMVEKVPAAQLTEPGFVLPQGTPKGSALPDVGALVIRTQSDKVPTPPPMSKPQFEQIYDGSKTE